MHRFDVVNEILEIEDDLGNELNLNPDEENELEDIIDEDMLYDDNNSDMDIENNFIEEDKIQNIEKVKKDNIIKNEIHELEKAFSSYNEDKMDLDID